MEEAHLDYFLSMIVADSNGGGSYTHPESKTFYSYIEGCPYVVVFVGVNGVRKSTNLAKGLENLPPSDNPAVYVSNHQSFLDIYTLLTLGRTFKFISKTGVFVIPIVGWAMFLMGLIPLRRMDSSSRLECLKRCMDLVRNGASVFFFPEGTRSRDGKLGAFKKGAFSVAAKTRVPVVPITLMGTGNLMPAGREDLLNTGSVRVVIHKPIEGSNPEILCNVARTAIADVLLRHGYGDPFRTVVLYIKLFGQGIGVKNHPIGLYSSLEDV
ncbi:1-acyl-sn-glycerol-3-phosphate acyltransferase lpat1, chloroplastic [Asimina triloba]